MICLVQAWLLRFVCITASLVLANASEMLQKSLVKADGHRNISVGLFSELEELARLVDITYCIGLANTGITRPFKCLSHCSEFPALELVETWNTGILQSDSCGYIALDHGKRRIIVAFRGTYSIANTIVDLSTIPQKYEPYPNSEHGPYADRLDGHACDNCRVHAGFHSSWLSTRFTILSTLNRTRLSFAEYELHLVGHSLGGAVAALAGLDTRARGWDPVVTTFGEPRVGNAELAHHLDERFDLLDRSSVTNHGQRYRRVTHIDDPVPLLPLTEWGYAMHAGEIYISSPSLPPQVNDVIYCKGDNDSACIAGQESTEAAVQELRTSSSRSQNSHRHIAPAMPQDDEKVSHAAWQFSPRYQLWQLFFAHRDYFWRLGLCVPSGYAT